MTDEEKNGITAAGLAQKAAEEERKGAGRVEPTVITPLEQAQRDAGNSPRIRGVPEPQGYDREAGQVAGDDETEKRKSRKGFFIALGLVAGLGVAYLGYHFRGEIGAFSRDLGGKEASVYGSSTDAVSDTTPRVAISEEEQGEKDAEIAGLYQGLDEIMEEENQQPYRVSRAGDTSLQQDIPGAQPAVATQKNNDEGKALPASDKKDLPQPLIDHDDDPSTPGITVDELKALYRKVIREKGHILGTFLQEYPGTPLYYLMENAVEDQRADVVHLLIGYGFGNKGTSVVKIRSWKEACSMAMEDYALLLEPRGTTLEEYGAVVSGTREKKGCVQLLADALGLPYELPQGKVLQLTLKKENVTGAKEE